MSELMLDKVVLLNVCLEKPGNTKGVSTSSVQVDADAKRVSVSKKLLDSKELKDIDYLDGVIRQYIYSRAIKTSALFKSGVYILPLGLVEDVINKLREFKIKREQLVEIFVQSYEGLVEDSRQELRGLFNPMDYPDAEAMRRKFQVTWQLIDVNVASAIETLNEELFIEQREQQAAKWRDAAQEVQDLLRAAMSDLVEYMVDRLTPNEKGGCKKFMASAIDGYKDFLETFDLRNVTNDDELQSLVAQARELMNGVDAKVLRSNDNLRAKVQDSFASIKSNLDNMLEDSGTRRRLVDFDA